MDTGLGQQHALKSLVGRKLFSPPMGASEPQPLRVVLTGHLGHSMGTKAL